MFKNNNRTSDFGSLKVKRVACLTVCLEFTSMSITTKWQGTAALWNVYKYILLCNIYRKLSKSSEFENIAITHFQ